MMIKNLLLASALLIAICSQAQNSLDNENLLAFDMAELETNGQSLTHTSNQFSIMYQNETNNEQHTLASNALLETFRYKKRTHPLEKTGKILTLVGVPLAILGGIMVAGADALYYNCVNGTCEGDPRGGFGVVILGAGLGLTGTGITLWAIGKNK